MNPAPAARSLAEYRDRLRVLFGAGGFRIMANGDIRTRTCAGMVWGRVGDAHTDNVLFGGAGRAEKAGDAAGNAQGQDQASEPLLADPSQAGGTLRPAMRELVRWLAEQAIAQAEKKATARNCAGAGPLPFSGR